MWLSWGVRVGQSWTSPFFSGEEQEEGTKEGQSERREFKEPCVRKDSNVGFFKGTKIKRPRKGSGGEWWTRAVLPSILILLLPVVSGVSLVGNPPRAFSEHLSWWNWWRLMAPQALGLIYLPQCSRSRQEVIAATVMCSETMWVPRRLT